MDDRRHERYTAQFEATVTDINDRARTASGCVSNISNSGIAIELPFALAPGDMVQVDLADSSLFGHIIYSHGESVSFRTGIEIAQVLIGGTDLAHLLRTILREAMPHVPGLELATSRR